jgi:hypothetical protein
MQLNVRGQLIEAKRAELEATDYRTGTNNFLTSIFSQNNISLNGVTITLSSDNYNYRAYLETILVYGSDAATSHLTNGHWYIDNGNLLACDSTDTYTDTTNKGFIRRWNLLKQSKVIEMEGRLHADVCNVPTYLLPGVRMQVKLTKAKREFYLMIKDSDSKVVFKFLDAQLLVKRVKPNPAYLIAHTKALQAGAVPKYNLTSVEVKTFTFASGSQSLFIDNAVLGTVPKRLLFKLTKNKDFFGSVDTNPFQL